MKNWSGWGVHIACCLALVHGPGAASAIQLASSDFTELSLDELLAIEVVTVSKAAEPASRAPAAIYVITRDEILRSGARSIPEALRLAPGVNVARISSREYAVSIRGFNSTSSDKLQVLIDGRSVYTPLFSGVFWDVVDTALMDIDRIEVVRGPGATLWGANAVNGVINIVTRAAQDTLGTATTIELGTERNSATLRSGQSMDVGQNSAMRVYAKAVERGSGNQSDGRAAVDGQRMVLGGIRADTELHGGDRWSVAANVYSSDADEPNGKETTDGTDINLLYQHPFGHDEAAPQLDVRVSYTGYRRSIPSTYQEKRDTYDAQVQYSAQFGQMHDLTAGLGYRYSADETGGPPLTIIFVPEDRSIDQPSAFLQDRVHLSEDLTLTIGTKIERNDFTGTEIQPGARIGYSLSPRTYFWSSIAKAVRTPNRLDHDLGLYCPPPDGFGAICGGGETLRIGNPEFDSETLIAYEGGWRRQWSDRISTDIALFYNDYDELRSTEPTASGIRFENRLRGTGSGGEISVLFKPSEDLDLRVWYAYLNLDIDDSDSSDSDSVATIEGSTPGHQALAALRWSPGLWTLDAIARFVDALPNAQVERYTELDLRIARPIFERCTLGLIGTNLLDSQHGEFGEMGSRVEPQRAVMLELRWDWAERSE